MSRDEKLRANQRRLAERRRANEIAKAKARKKKTPETKTESKPKTRTNTSVAFDKKNDFGSLLKTPKTETPQRPPQRPPQGSQDGPKDPPKQPRTPKPETHSAHDRTVPYRSRRAGLTQSNEDGTYGKGQPSNPDVGYSKPVRRNFKTQAAFLKALEVYMRRKKRGEQAARSTGKNKAKQATDGRQYGG